MTSHEIDDATLAESNLLWDFSLTRLRVRFLYDTFCGTSVWLHCVYNFHTISHQIEEAPLAGSHILWNFSLTPLRVRCLYDFPSTRRGALSEITLFGSSEWLPCRYDFYEFLIKYTRHPWRNCIVWTFGAIPVYDFYEVPHEIDEATLAESHFLNLRNDSPECAISIRFSIK